MAWHPLGTQFCLELAFGVLFALAFVPRAPVGAGFYRLLGTSACLPLLVAIGAPLAAGERGWDDPLVLCALPALAAYPVYSGPFRGWRFALALGLALASSGAAVALSVAQGAPAGRGAAGLALAVASALATGAVAGSVGLAMVLGHWYLTVPNLDVRHLGRLNRVAAASMLASLGLVLASCLFFAETLGAGDAPLFGPTGLFHLGTRLSVGLFFPLAFAWMAASSLRFRNTRSATGILYASTVLVLIGTAVSLALQDAYGVPL
jgi:hypothetical protein